jgi:hypothetical protein
MIRTDLHPLYAGWQASPVWVRGLALLLLAYALIFVTGAIETTISGNLMVEPRRDHRRPQPWQFWAYRVRWRRIREGTYVRACLHGQPAREGKVVARLTGLPIGGTVVVHSDRYGLFLAPVMHCTRLPHPVWSLQAWRDGLAFVRGELPDTTCQEAVLDVIAETGSIAHQDLMNRLGEDGCGFTVAEVGAALLALVKDGEIEPGNDPASTWKSNWKLTGWHQAQARAASTDPLTVLMVDEVPEVLVSLPGGGKYAGLPPS